MTLSVSTAVASASVGARPPPLPTVPPEVAQHGNDWPLPGRDYDNSRAVVPSAITTESVSRLQVAWSVPLPGSAGYGNASTTPLIVGNTVYVQDLQSNVRAIDLSSGKVLWIHNYNTFEVGPDGVAVGYGRVYVQKNSQEIAALDAKTGREIWSTRLTLTKTDGIDIQPTVVAGLVLASTTPISVRDQYKGGDRGVLWALDARTGKRVWTFDTVQSKTLWGHPEINSGGGAWYPPAVDLKRGLVYWGIANPAPFSGTAEFPNGSSRPGPNLYTDSLVALHLRTGKLAWFYQETPHDLFDYDFVLTAIANTPGGNLTQRVIGTGKAGHVVALDPINGKKLIDTPVGMHQNDNLKRLTSPTNVLPGEFGGVLTPPAVADGTIYVAAVNAPSTYYPNKTDFFAGATLGQLPGQIEAVDARSGRVLWDTPVDGDPLGGTLVLGDLVLTGTFQGTIIALNRSTGKIVRTMTAPGGINGWPAATHNTIVWPIGIGKSPSLVAYRLS